MPKRATGNEARKPAVGTLCDFIDEAAPEDMALPNLAGSRVVG